MDTPKTLAAQALSAADHVLTQEKTSILLRKIADYLDRLSAPDVSVGLTRYTPWLETDDIVGMTPDPEGEYVRYEDHAAEVAKLNSAGEYYAKEARDWQTIAEVNKDHGEQALAAARAEAFHRGVVAGLRRAAAITNGFDGIDAKADWSTLNRLCEHLLSESTRAEGSVATDELYDRAEAAEAREKAEREQRENWQSRAAERDAEAEKWFRQMGAERDRAEQAEAREKAKDEEIAGLTAERDKLKEALRILKDHRAMPDREGPMIARGELSGREPDTKDGTPPDDDPPNDGDDYADRAAWKAHRG